MQSLPPDFHKYNIIFNALLFYIQYYISYNIICQPIKPVTGSLLRMRARKKNVPWHIPAPAAVACDIYLIRRSAHPRGAFFTLQESNFL